MIHARYVQILGDEIELILFLWVKHQCRFGVALAESISWMILRLQWWLPLLIFIQLYYYHADLFMFKIIWTELKCTLYCSVADCTSAVRHALSPFRVAVAAAWEEETPSLIASDQRRGRDAAQVAMAGWGERICSFLFLVVLLYQHISLCA
jgi:hypothetical protein